MLETLLLTSFIGAFVAIAVANYYKFGRNLSQWLLLPFLSQTTSFNRRSNSMFNPIYHLDTDRHIPSFTPDCSGDCCEKESPVETFEKAFGKTEKSKNKEPEISELDRKIAEYQEETNSKVIFLIHQAPKSSALGYMFDSIIESYAQPLSTADTIRFLDIIRELPDDTDIDLILHTKGGMMSAAEVIVKALLKHEGKVRIHIPYFAESAGTLIAMAADEIYFHESSWLTQIDPQMAYWSASTMIDFTQNLAEPLQTTFIRDLARIAAIPAQKAMDRAINLTRTICETRNYTPEETDKLIDHLVRGRSNHDKPLLIEDLGQTIKGITSTSKIPPKILELYRLRTTTPTKKSSSQSMFGL